MAKLSTSQLVFTSAYGARDPIKTAAGVTESFHLGIDFGPVVRNTPGIVLRSVIAGHATHLSDQYGALGVRTTATATGDLLATLRRLYGFKSVPEGAAVMLDLWHLASRLVARGVDVVAGAVLGVMGSTGRSTGVHVHVELRIGGRVVDPKPFIDAQASKAVAPAADDYYEGALTVSDFEFLRGKLAVLQGQGDAVLELLRVPDQGYGYPEHAANQAIAAGETARVVQRQGEAILDLLRVPGQPFGWPQHAASLAGAVLALVQQQAAAQGVTIDTAAIVAELRDSLGDAVADVIADRLRS